MMEGQVVVIESLLRHNHIRRSPTYCNYNYWPGVTEVNKNRAEEKVSVNPKLTFITRSRVKFTDDIDVMVPILACWDVSSPW